MNRRTWQRTCLLAILILPAIAILGMAWRADAQPGSPHFEMQWKCGKCGGNLGNGVNPPSSCPRCGVKLRSYRNTSWDGPAANAPRSRAAETAKESSSPWGKAVAIAVAGLGIVVLGLIVMKDRGPEQLTDSGRR